MLVACSFTQVTGVAQLDQEVVTGLIDSNQEGDRVYVGTIESGDRWDAHARLRVINPTTGVEINDVLSPTGNPIRAVAESTSDDSVWVLLDNGTLNNYSKDLSFNSSSTFFFSPPSGGTLVRFCDLEQLPNGHFVATGVYANVVGAPRGFWSYVQPKPGNPGSWHEVHGQYAINPNANFDQACPRVTHETQTSETIFLQPYKYTGGVTKHEVVRFKLVLRAGGMSELESLGSWTITVDPKWLPGDITAEYEKVIIARQHATDLADGHLMMFEQTTGVMDDSINLHRARAVDFALWPQNNGDLSTMLWWGGLEDDTGSGFEVGVVGFSDP